MFKKIKQWFAALFTSPGVTGLPIVTTSPNPVVAAESKVATVTLTISSPLNKVAFEFSVTNPAGDPKEVFSEFEKWFQSAGTEQYMFTSENFRAVVMRRHISGYLVTVRNA